MSRSTPPWIESASRWDATGDAANTIKNAEGTTTNHFDHNARESSADWITAARSWRGHRTSIGSNIRV